MRKQTIMAENLAVGNYYRARRKLLKITQIEMCEKLRISQGSLSKIENGWYELNVSQFANLIDLLKLTPKDVKYIFNLSRRSY